MPRAASGNRVLRIRVQRRVRIPPGAQECQRSWQQGKRVPVCGQKSAGIPPGRQRRERVATGGQRGGTKIREVQGIAAMVATMAIAAETAADFPQLFEEQDIVLKRRGLLHGHVHSGHSRLAGQFQGIKHHRSLLVHSRHCWLSFSGYQEAQNFTHLHWTLLDLSFK